MVMLVRREMSDSGEVKYAVLANGTRQEMFRLWVDTQDKNGLEIVDYDNN